MADQKIVPFLFESEHMVRTIERETAPWFVLADLCRVLEIGNVGNAVARLDPEEKDDIQIVDAIGRQQQTAIVNESGLYSLVLTSRKPKAKAFKKWITNEVIPSIRRTGSYALPGQVEVIRRKPFEEWTVEEVNAYRGLVTEARHTLNVASAAWMMERLGFPMPPRHLLPAWQQGIEGF